MVNKWTPGPWSVESEAAPNGEFEVVAPDTKEGGSWNIAKTHGSVGYGEGEIEALANARLIAAAPDLYKFASQALMPMHDAAIFLAASDDASDANAAGDLWAAYEALKAALAKASDGGA